MGAEERPPATAPLAAVWRAGARGFRRELPARYDPALLPPGYEHRVWRYPFDRRFAELAIPGIAILDIGAGRWPTLTPAQRPAAATYVGLDVSRHQLDQAADGSYDEVIVGDAAAPPAGLDGRFDVVVSWLLFEHLPDVGTALDAVRSCLRDGGTALIFLAGGNAVPARINRAVPRPVSKWLLTHLNGRDPDSIFEAHYDRCSWSGLHRLAGGWGTFEVEPFYWAANYFRFSRLSLAAWLAYEEWLVRAAKVDRASFYLLCARR